MRVYKKRDDLRHSKTLKGKNAPFNIEVVKLSEFIWPNSPLVTVKGRHDRSGDKVRYNWDDLELCTFGEIISGVLKFDVRLESDSTSRRSEFRILVERLDKWHDVTGVIHDADTYYVKNDETETVIISAPIIEPDWIHFKVTIWSLQDRSMSGTVTWYNPQSKIYEAWGFELPSKYPDCCIMATATSGTEMASPVQFLREFRDNTVLKSRYSRFFEKSLDVYYIFSTPIAKAMKEHKALNFGIKYAIVWPFVKFAQACVIIIDFFVKRSEYL